MKKKILLIALVLCILSFFVLPLSAEEVPTEEPPTTTTTDSQTEPTAPPEDSGDITLDINGATVTVTEFFNNNILPVLTGVGTVILMFLAFLAPILKLVGKYKNLQGLFTQQGEQNAAYEKILSATDIAKFSETLKSFVNDELKKTLDTDFKGVVEKAMIDKNLAESIEARMETMSAQIDALIRGATNAWAQAPAAVSCLTSAPTETVLKKQVSEIHALEAYIREQKGAEADAIIEKLKGGAEHDELGQAPAV